jgi:hypothetical protein
MFLRRSPDTEAAPHFVYPIRHNPLNRKNSFLLSTMFSACRTINCKVCTMAQERLPFISNSICKNNRKARLMGYWASPG